MIEPSAETVTLVPSPLPQPSAELLDDDDSYLLASYKSGGGFCSQDSQCGTLSHGECSDNRCVCGSLLHGGPHCTELLTDSPESCAHVRLAAHQALDERGVGGSLRVCAAPLVYNETELAFLIDASCDHDDTAGPLLHEACRIGTTAHANCSAWANASEILQECGVPHSTLCAADMCHDSMWLTPAQFARATSQPTPAGANDG